MVLQYFKRIRREKLRENIKYYIYTNSCLKKKLSFLSLKACLINLYKTEKMIAVRNQRIAEFQLHWSTFEKLFEDC